MRWKALIPTTLLVAAIAAFAVFFLDAFVKCAVERAGSSVNGAKVELDSARVSLKNFSVTLRHLQVADKENPMTNALEVDALKFDLAGKPLSWKKVIIENGEIAGIRTGTPRKTSGALPKKAASPDEAKESASEEPSKVVEMGKEAASFAMTNLKDQYDPQKLVQPENLASYKKIMEEQEHFTTISREWESKVDGLQVGDNLDAAKSFVEKAKNQNFSGVEGLKKAKDTIDEAKKFKDDLKAAGESVSALKSTLTAEFARARNGLREIDRLKNEDYRGVLGNIKGGMFTAEGITRGLIGPEWFAKLQTGIAWFHKVRKYIPKKKEEAKPPPPPPRVGRDIHFPFHYAWPAFHLKRAAVSGVTAGEAPLDWSGTLTDVTSDPKLVGKPIALDIAGKRQNGPQSLTLRTELDFTTDVPREAVKLAYKGLQLAGTKLGNVGAPVSIARGDGTVTADLEAKGEQLAGTIKFLAEPVALDHALTPDQAKNKLLSIIHDVLAKLNALDATVTVSDTIKSPDFKINTTLDNQFEAAVKQVLAKELEELKAKFRARVDELVNEQRKKLTGMIEAKTGLVAGKINSKEDAVKAAQEMLDKQVDDLKKKAQESVPVPANLPVNIPGVSKPSEGSSGGESKPALPEIKNPFKKK